MTLVTLNLTPEARYQAFDVRQHLAPFLDDIDRHRKSLYCSLHTTAGYLDRGMAARLRHAQGLAHFFGAFQTLFPPGAPYKHDHMELRTELSPDQKRTEPRNGDSHLTFIGSGLRNCVTSYNHPDRPVYFVDLDGVDEGNGTRRQRQTTVLAYDTERVIERRRFDIPVSRHPIDSVNLSDPRSGFLQEVHELLQRAGLGQGRVDIMLDAAEGNAGLTVNEYETLLMKHDLAEVLQDPLKFAVAKGRDLRSLLDNPLTIPGKTVGYAQYDFVRVFNSLMDLFGVNESALEKLLADLIAVPARRFLRMKRGISFLATASEGAPQLVRGRYQSPILVQWRSAASSVRALEVSLLELR
jgi:hypothetical protein